MKTHSAHHHMQFATNLVMLTSCKVALPIAARMAEIDPQTIKDFNENVELPLSELRKLRNVAKETSANKNACLALLQEPEFNKHFGITKEDANAFTDQVVADEVVCAKAYRELNNSIRQAFATFILISIGVKL